MSRKLNLVGKVFGLLTVLSEAGRRRGYVTWLCRCECGNEREVISSFLKDGNTKSCGCLNGQPNKRYAANGQSNVNGKKTPEYNAWCHIKDRCCNPRNKEWDNYGGRGITMFYGWLNDFKAFYDYMGPKPGTEYSIDRIDNDGNYEPSNVKWSTPKEQSNNQRTKSKYERKR